ncbi:NAD(P)H pyrophosphatase NUDT13, mitochondrial [Gastrophryne carolinensis]
MFNAVVQCTVRSLHVRRCSSYIKQTRYLFELKENDDICRQALRSGSFYLFHNLSTLVRKSDSSYYSPAISYSDLLEILSQYGKDKRILEDTVVVGCTESDTAEFALDLGSLEQSSLEKNLSGKFTDFRKAIMKINGENQAVLSRAHALLRWHECNQYCSKSGKPTQKNVSGSKRICNSNGIIYYPQMSPVMITLVSNGSHCLLATQESFPPGMYTALAGFCEIGETLEETVRREVAEEVGLEVDTIRYSGSQHWPFPKSSLMIACQATTKNEKITINSAEIKDARWFSSDEVTKALRVKMLPPKLPDGTIPVWVPPKHTIAHHLIQEWLQEQKAL